MRTRVVAGGFLALAAGLVSVTPAASAVPGEALADAIPRFLFWAMPLLVAVLLTLLSLFVLIRGQPVIYNRVFFVLYSTSAVKSLTEGLLALLPDQPTAFRSSIVNLNLATGYVLVTLFLWFVLVFPRPVRPWLKQGYRGAITLLLAAPFLFVLVFGVFSISDTVNAFNAYASLVTVAGLGLLVYHAWETDSDEERHRIRLLAMTFSLNVFSTIVIFILYFLALDAFSAGDTTAFQGYFNLARAFLLVLAPVLEIVGATILMYAILRYQLLGVELLVKRVTRATLFALTIGFVFVVVSNSVEQLFQITVLAGVPLDFLIAGFISAAMMYPVQKGTERIANRIFPRADSQQPDYLAQRRMEIYEAQLRYAFLDGTLKEKELTMLHALRESLGIKPEELQQVVRRFPGIDVGVLLAPAPRPQPA